MQPEKCSPLPSEQIAMTIPAEIANLRDVSNLRGRLLQLVEEAGSQIELCRRSGLTTSHVNRLLARLEKDPNHDPKGSTLRKIAQGMNKSLAWLMTGRGPEGPYEDWHRPDDPYPNRQKAAEHAAAIGLAAEAIAYVVNRDWGDPNDPTVRKWFRRMEFAEQELSRRD